MVKLEHFSREEFREWYERMSPRLLVMLDVLRHRLGRGVSISLNDHALGRVLGFDDLSEHNIDRWGQVLAADCFVTGVYTRKQAEGVVHEALSIGFTGIGVYADTNNLGLKQVMFHFGVRPNRLMGDPATWGRVSGQYTSLVEALGALPDEHA